MSVRSSRLPSLPRTQRRLGSTGGLDHPLVGLLGAMLLVRVLTDDLSSPASRHSGSLNLSAAIAVLLIVVATSVLLRQRRGMLPTTLAVFWLCVWTGVAVSTRGASAETLREGVRELSVVALAVIVYNGRGAVTGSVAARMIALIGLVPALVALYQFATHTGMFVAGNIRSNGTFAHPNSAAMFFAIAAIASLYLYLDNGRHRFDALLTALFAAALITTFSIDGLITLSAMLVLFGALHPGSRYVKLGPSLMALAIVLAFFATPLGSRRIAKESGTNVATAERNESNSSLAWRLNKWKTLIPKWERRPVFGQGLGTTTTEPGIRGNEFAGALPHNEYLRCLVETGVVGLAILLCCLGMMVRGLLDRRRTPARDAVTVNAATLAIVVLAGCLVDSLADNTFLNSPTCYAATLIVIAVLCLPSIEKHRRPTVTRV